MASRSSDRNSVEERGLLRSNSFELEDVEVSEQNHKGTARSSEDRPYARRGWKQASAWSRFRNTCVGFAAAVAIISIVLLLIILGHDEVVYRAQRHKLNEEMASKIIEEQMAKALRPADVTPKRPAKVQPSGPPTVVQSNLFEKPEGFKVIGLIFYGRRATIAVLDCYLKKNLLSNGGFLDEVHWAINTSNQDDLDYLDELVKTTDEYKKITIPEFGYNSIWEHAVQPEHMYIKIDDDIVYLNDDAIPNLVFSKLSHPESLNVVANLVNSPETGWLHYRMGAVHAYLPEYEPPAPDESGASYGPKAWRASALPQWGDVSASQGSISQEENNGSDLMGAEPAQPPFVGHRWLPLPRAEENLYRTPISQSQYNAYGPDWTSWAIAAQVHYSLLENIENNQLSRYHYGSGLDTTREGIWNMVYERMNINVMAIWGKDVLDNLPFEGTDDEHELSVNIPLKLRRPCLVNTHVIAGHFSFGPQPQVYQTDLLSRYRAYANEKICASDNQIPIP